MAGTVELEHLVKRYGQGAAAVEDVSLSVADGELIALLGPSGCGKTTTLRMVAGFVTPTSGRIVIDGEDVTRREPYRRNTGMVFQSYALFPHLTVSENIAFGLRRRRVAQSSIAAKVREMIGLLHLEGLQDRLPAQLSGGQQQRVALGRVLVINPAVVLLDEPFSNLDAQLRESTRAETRRIQQELGLTALFVTHDQAEAMAIADRVAVMEGGRIVQIDTPQALYATPKTRFVASFIGRANLLEATVVHVNPNETLMRAAAGCDLVLPGICAAGTVVLRPEAITLGHDPDGRPNTVAGAVETVSFLGATAQVTIRTAGGVQLVAEVPGAVAGRFMRGDAVVAGWFAESLTVVAS